MNSFAQAIYIARLEKGLSQQELAFKAGIPQPNLSRIEKGRDFKVSTLFQLALALNISMEDLIRGKKPEEIDKKRLFQRNNIEMVISCVIHHVKAPRELKSAVELISTLVSKKTLSSKKQAHLSWYRLKKSFSDEEIHAILSRLNKAKRRTR